MRSIALSPFVALALLPHLGAAQCGTTFEYFDQSIAPVFEPRVQEFALYDPDGPGPEEERLAIVGSFFDLDGQALNDLVTYDVDSGSFSQLASGTGHNLVGVAAGPDGQLAVLFQDGFTSSGVLLWDGQGWTPLVTVTTGPWGGDTILDILYLPNGDLVLGGSFSSIAGVPAPKVARWDGSVWTAMGQGLVGDVWTLRLDPSGDLIAGTVGVSAGPAVEGVARFDGATWSPLWVGTQGIAAAVNDLAFLADGRVAATGVFNFPSQSIESSLAIWDGSDWVLPGGIPVPLVTSGFSTAHAVAELPSGDLVVGGDFDVVGGVATGGLGRWNGSTWSKLLSSFIPIASVSDLMLGLGGDLWAGGQFRFGASSLAGGLARVVPSCKAGTVSYGSSGSGSAGAIELVSQGLPWIGTTYRADVASIPSGAAVSGLIGLQPDSLPLALFSPSASPDSSLLLVPLLGLIAPLPSANGAADWDLPIPANSSLVGLPIYLQALSFEITAGGAPLFATSNGLTLTPGAF